MKSRIIKIFAFVLVFFAVSLSVYAIGSTTINQNSLDGSLGFNTLGTSNYTDCQGCTNWSSSSQAKAGDIVAFMIYYHNSGSQPAQNLRVQLSPSSTGSNTSQTFTATVSADNAQSAIGTATVNLSSSQSLSFDPSYARQCSIDGQYDCQMISGSSIVGSGLDLGTISPDSTCTSGSQGGSFCHQGTIVLHYIVSNNNINTGSSPTVTTQSATNLVNGSATLNGSAYSNSSNLTTCWFLWGSNSNPTQYLSSNCNNTTNTQFSQSLSGLSSNITYYYEACAENSYGQNCGQVVPFSVGGNNNNPTSVFVQTLYPTNITQSSATLNGTVSGTNGNTVNLWFMWGTSFYNLSNQINSTNQSQSWDGNFSGQLYGLAPNTTYYYEACAQSFSNNFGQNFGQNCGTTLSFTTQNNTSITQANVSAVTELPSLITQTSAELNGIGTSSVYNYNNIYNYNNNYNYNSNNTSLSGWFEWGTSVAFGNQTNAQNLGSAASANFFSTIIGLNPGTFYFYRAVVQAADGTIAYGQVQTFGTLSNSIAPVPVVIHTGTGGGSGSSLVQLDVTDNSQGECIGDTLHYNIHYKNISGRTLSDTVLTIELPQEVSFVDASQGQYSDSNHSVVVSLGTLVSGQEDTISVDGQLLSTAKNQDLLVTTATIAFTNPISKAQDDAIAYDLNNVNLCRSSLAGLALFGSNFFPQTLLGWLLIILVILVLIWIAREIYNRRSVQQMNNTTHLPPSMPPMNQ